MKKPMCRVLLCRLVWVLNIFVYWHGICPSQQINNRLENKIQVLNKFESVDELSLKAIPIIVKPVPFWSNF